MKPADYPHTFDSRSHAPARVLVAVLAVAGVFSIARGQEVAEQRFSVREYRVSGARKLTSLEVQEAVYPFLGPRRSAEDVERARGALEAAFRAKGFETVTVLIPQQDPRYGVIRFEVVEGTVGRLRVNGARYFSPARVRAEAPSMAEGTVPDMNRVKQEIVALNKLNDRRVTPALRPGIEPGTVDIDLNVEDKLPLHGSLELNNRYSADTTRLRLAGALSYGNLFQRGHTGGVNFQVAPENTDDSLVYSAYYMARINETLSLMLQGTKQESDISTLGGSTAVVGRGEIVGLRGVFDLPSGASLYHNLTLGLDYKRLDEETFVFGDSIVVLSAPIEYYPLSASYSGTWFGTKNFTQLNAALTLNLRGLGSGESAFNEKRAYADGNFLYLRADLAHTRDLKDGSQLYGKIQGQLADGPLINSEQYSGGGLGSARGYLEASALGDNGIFATAEYRTPSYIGTEDAAGNRRDEWRLHAFLEGGLLGIYDPLPGQDSTTTFASIGVGTRLRLAEHFNGSIDIALPLLDAGTSDAFDPALTFRGWADF